MRAYFSHRDNTNDLALLESTICPYTSSFFCIDKHRLHMNRFLAVFLSLLCVTSYAQEQAYPVKPIRLLVGYAPGGATDIVARSIAIKLQETLGQPVVVENRAGASSNIASEFVAKSTPDGYTLLLSANTVAQAPAFKTDAGYDLDKDFAAIGMLIRAPFLMVGPPNQPSRTLAEFVAQAKANPDKMSMASAGLGTSTHMAAALFMHQAGIKLLHVPYKGNAAAMPDVIGGRVNAIFDGGNSSGPAVRDGRLRAYGITSPQRSPACPCPSATS